MSRLVARFAVSSLIAFVVIGTVVSVVLSRQIRQRQEASAKFHAEFVTNSILRYVLSPKDLSSPKSPPVSVTSPSLRTSSNAVWLRSCFRPTCRFGYLARPVRLRRLRRYIRTTRGSSLR